MLSIGYYSVVQSSTSGKYLVEPSSLALRWPLACLELRNKSEEETSTLRGEGFRFVAWLMFFSCVVFGMPKEAIEQGAVNQVASLEEIASIMVSKVSR